MRAQLTGLAAAEQPVSVHTFGFGADHDARLLQAIAEAGHGIYYFIQVSDEGNPGSLVVNGCRNG